MPQLSDFVVSYEEIKTWYKQNPTLLSERRPSVEEARKSVLAEKRAIFNYRLKDKDGFKFLTDMNIRMLINQEALEAIRAKDRVRKEAEEAWQKARDEKRTRNVEPVQRAMDAHYSKIDEHIAELSQQKGFSSRHYREVRAEAAEKRIKQDSESPYEEQFSRLEQSENEIVAFKVGGSWAKIKSCQMSNLLLLPNLT